MDGKECCPEEVFFARSKVILIRRAIDWVVSNHFIHQEGKSPVDGKQAFFNDIFFFGIGSFESNPPPPPLEGFVKTLFVGPNF